MQYLTDNTRIKGLLEVTPPIKLIDKLPLSSKASKLVMNQGMNYPQFLSKKMTVY